MFSKMASGDSLSELWETACNNYAQETGTPLTSPDFPKVSTPSDLSSHLDSEKEHFADFRMKKRPLFHAMQTILTPFENFGDIISGAVSIAFPPASTIMGAMLLLIRSARRVSDAFDSVNALFEKLGYFAQRLDSYRGVPLSEGMKNIIVKVFVTFLNACGVSQSLLSRGAFRARFSKWARNVLVEDTSIQGLLAELEALTGLEHKMVSAHNLTLTSQALKNTAILLEKSELENDKERISALKALLGPISASGQVYSAISESRIPGSGKWVEEVISEWWDRGEPLLWIHGGPGVGKSYLASKIIGDLAIKSDAVVASFFFKNNDVDLRSFNKALRTLAWQIVVLQPSFAVYAEDFCLKGDPDNTYVVWNKLFLDYFEKSDDTVCLIIDGIDEADSDEQEIFFSLLERTFPEEMDRKPPLRVVLLGRDSVRSIIEEHSLGWIHDIEITHSENKDDLHGFVSQRLQKSKLFRNASDFQDEVIQDICAQAEGLWEWANLVIKNVMRCRTKEQIRKVVKTMPKGISAMLHEELQRLGKELSASDMMSDDEGSQIQQLNILLSSVTLAQRPLTVEQLDLVLEIVLGEEVLNLEDDLLKVYSSLVSLRVPENDYNEYDDSTVVTLRHSSFYEFFESPSIDAGSIHINRDQGGANFLYAIIYALTNVETPKSYRWLVHLRRYAKKYLSLHLESVDPENVTSSRRDDISSLLTELLTNELWLRFWLIDPIYEQSFSRYTFHSSSRISELGRYWWGCNDRDTANEAAEMVFKWLTPAQQRAFEELAGDDACPFAVLFSSLVRLCSRLWLCPEDINDDGLPAALPTLLWSYAEITATPSSSDGTSKKLKDISIGLQSAEILQTAESQCLQKTAMWYARVAQSMLQHGNSQDALVHFHIALDEHDKAPSLSEQSISVIHKDMARAYSEVGKYKEALEHSDLVLSPDNNPEDPGYDFQRYLGSLLDEANMLYRVKSTEKAISTALHAWEQFVTLTETHAFGDLWLSFFVVFSELRQPQRFRSVLDLAFDRSEKILNPIIDEIEGDSFTIFLIDAFASRFGIMHSVLHYALTPEDTALLDLIASIPGVLKGATPEWLNPIVLKFWIASVLFDKGRPREAIQIWNEVALVPGESGHSWIQPFQTRAMSRLATACLYWPQIPFYGNNPPAFVEDDINEVSLIVSSWLLDNGDMVHARQLLSEVVRRCIALLSDDTPANDIDAFVILFKVFLMIEDSDDDLRAALYLIKAWGKESDDPALGDDVVGVVQTDVSSVLEKVRLADDEAQMQDEDPEDDWAAPYDDWFTTDPSTHCSTCKDVIRSLNRWHFCRSCPLTVLCHHCYRELQSKSDPTQDHPRGFVGRCSPQHKFFYSGAALRQTGYVSKGMVPLVGTDGKRQVVWIDEWKEKLAEKWVGAGTEQLNLDDGGLSAGCMQVLPEAQRDRWGKFFKV
jgi:tetratricopeptide (TPR) repeat protein